MSVENSLNSIFETDGRRRNSFDNVHLDVSMIDLSFPTVSFGWAQHGRSFGSRQYYGCP